MLEISLLRWLECMSYAACSRNESAELTRANCQSVSTPLGQVVEFK